MPCFSHTITHSGKGYQYDKKFRHFFGKIDALEKGSGKYIGNEKKPKSRNTKNQNRHFHSINKFTSINIKFLEKAIMASLYIVMTISVVA